MKDMFVIVTGNFSTVIVSDFVDGYFVRKLFLARNKSRRFYSIPNYKFKDGAVFDTASIVDNDIHSGWLMI